MMIIEIHGLGREAAEEIRTQILEIIFDISWVDTKLDSVEICGSDIVGRRNIKKSHLKILSSYPEIQNLIILNKLMFLKLPIYIIPAIVYEGG